MVGQGGGASEGAEGGIGGSVKANEGEGGQEGVRSRAWPPRVHHRLRNVCLSKCSQLPGST